MMTTAMMSRKITLANETKQTKEKKEDYDDDGVKYIEDMYRYLSFFFVFFAFLL